MYAAPLVLQAGEVPADLLARLPKRPESDPTWGIVRDADDVTPRKRGVSDGARTRDLQGHNLAL